MITKRTFYINFLFTDITNSNAYKQRKFVKQEQFVLFVTAGRMQTNQQANITDCFGFLDQNSSAVLHLLSHWEVFFMRRVWLIFMAGSKGPLNQYLDTAIVPTFVTNHWQSMEHYSIRLFVEFFAKVLRIFSFELWQLHSLVIQTCKLSFLLVLSTDLGSAVAVRTCGKNFRNQLH